MHLSVELPTYLPSFRKHPYFLNSACGLEPLSLCQCDSCNTPDTFTTCNHLVCTCAGQGVYHTRKRLDIIVFIYLFVYFPFSFVEVLSYSLCMYTSSSSIYRLTARVVGALQMISQPVFSIFPCSSLPSGTCRTPGLSIT